MLDTNVWLDVLVFDDPRCAVLVDAMRSGAVDAVGDAATAAEFARVLGYPALALDEYRRAEARARYVDLARAVQPGAVARPPRCGDPDDQMFVDLALGAGADALLTRDDELLRLARRLRPHGIEVTTPAEWCAARAAQISKR